jgi:hypothetical protein
MGDLTSLNNFKSKQDFGAVSAFERSFYSTETRFICEKNNNKVKPNKDMVACNRIRNYRRYIL